DEQDMGEGILDGGHPLEPKPAKGRTAFIKLSVQAAHDKDNLYIRFKWKTKSKGPARVTMMLDDGKVPNFAAQGCWLTCHNGMRSAPGEVSEAKVKAHPLLGDGGLKKKDVRKYLAASRKDGKSWDKTKSKADIAKTKKAGGFVDLVYWRFKDGKPQTKDAYVLEYRLDDAKNSIGDAGKSKGELKNGVYTVVIQRKLNTGHPADDKVLKVGGVYSVGFAIHDGEVGDRFHNTAFPLRLGIGKKADITAVAVK
ncbi:MAG: ethylbenzene dehydrogenase-related protein, partial [Gammaproteobacteria bacterium]|nr:ethylbenzene dehydrogenase-related protein [Gammaproteobacteria bacterium]